MGTQWQVVMLGKFDDEVFRSEHVFQALLLVKWHLFAAILPKILMNPHKFLLKLEIDFFGTNILLMYSKNISMNYHMPM